jgi:hypothetical protein
MKDGFILFNITINYFFTNNALLAYKSPSCSQMLDFTAEHTATDIAMPEHITFIVL